jgi:hypothetical protein
MAVNTLVRHAAAATALISLISFPGCRFGNQVIQAQDPTSMSGFYKTEAQAMSICANLAGEDWRCANASTTMIPQVIQSIMTDPVYVSANTARAKAYLVPHSLDTSNYFEMTLTKTGDLTSPVSAGEPQTLWTDDACQTQLQLSKEGKVRASASSSTQGSFKVSGSLNFSVAVVSALSGDCDATLAELRACYLDSTKCPGETAQEQTEAHESVLDYFAPYIAAGVLAADEIPQLEAFGWEATYR